MIIRPERQLEYNAIHAFIQRAFETAKVADGNEQDYADSLRTGGGYIPELALVAEEGGTLLGHIMLTKTYVENTENDKWELLLLAPLSVELAYRNQGIGGALVKEAMKRAEELGFRGVALVGDPAYYGRFGFHRSTDFSVSYPGDIEAKYVQVAELFPGALAHVSGLLCIPH